MSVAALVAAFASSMPAYAEQWITLSESQPLVATTDKPMHVSQSIGLGKGQDQLQLYLTYMNGSATAPSYTWIRVSSSSMSYVNEKQFQNKMLTQNVSGELTWGGNQILISGAGPVGASFSWILRTPQPTVSGVSGGTVYPGNSITITGTNLCPNPDANIVTIGGQSASVISASPTQLVVRVPQEVKGGANLIALNVAGLKVNLVLSVNITAAPYLSSTSAAFVAPANNVTIYGEGFDPNPNNDQVWMGPFQAQVVSATEGSLTITAPAQCSDPWYAPNLMTLGAFWPIKVVVNGIKARNTLNIRCSDI